MLYPQTDSDDLRATIEASYETEAKTPEVQAEVAEEPVVETEEPEANDEPGDHPTDPTRRADGKFKPQKTEAAPEKAAPETEITPSKDDQTKASEVVAQTTTVAPPAGWTAAEKAEWSKLPPAIQAAVSRREAEITNGGKQWSEEKRRYEAAIAPISQAARSRGLDVGQAAHLLAAAQNALDQNPIEGIKRIAATYGVDLATLAGQQPAEGSQQQVQPDIAALVRQAVNPILAPIQQRMMAEEHQRQQSIENFVTDFASAPGHEHFDAVESELMAMIPQIKASNPGWSHEKVLQDAYDRAVWANPQTRAAIQTAATQAADAKRQQEAKQRVNTARRAAVSVTGAPSGASSTAPKDSLRAEIEAAFAGE